MTIEQNGTEPVKYCGSYTSRTGATSLMIPNNGYGPATTGPARDRLVFQTLSSYEYDGFKICLDTAPSLRRPA